MCVRDLEMVVQLKTVKSCIDRIYDVKCFEQMHTQYEVASSPMTDTRLRFQVRFSSQGGQHRKDEDDDHYWRWRRRRVNKFVEFTPSWLIPFAYEKQVAIQSTASYNPHLIFWKHYRAMIKEAVYTELDRARIPVTERSVLVYNYISKSRSTLLRNLSRRALAEDLFYSRTETDFVYQEAVNVHPPDAHSGPTEYALSTFSTAYFPSASFWSAFPVKKEALLSEQYYAVYDASNANSAHTYFADRPPENIQPLVLLLHLIIAYRVLQPKGVFTITIMANEFFEFSVPTLQVLQVFTSLFEWVHLVKSLHRVGNIQCICSGFRHFVEATYTKLRDLYQVIYRSTLPVTTLFDSPTPPTAKNVISVEYVQRVAKKSVAHTNELHTLLETLTPTFFEQNRRRTAMESHDIWHYIQHKQRALADHFLRTHYHVQLPWWQRTRTFAYGSNVKHLVLVNIPGTHVDNILDTLRPLCIGTRSSTHQLWFYNRSRQHHVVLHAYPDMNEADYPTDIRPEYVLVLTKAPFERFVRCMRALLNATDDTPRLYHLRTVFAKHGVLSVADFFNASPLFQRALIDNYWLRPQTTYINTRSTVENRVVSGIDKDIMNVMDYYIHSDIQSTHTETTRMSLSDTDQERLYELYVDDFKYVLGYQNQLTFDSRVKYLHLSSSLRYAYSPSERRSMLACLQHFLLGEFLSVIEQIHEVPSQYSLMVFIHRHPAHTSHLREQQAMVDALNYGELERARPGLKIMVEHSNKLDIPCTHLQSFDEINWDEYTEHSFRSKSLVHLIRTACTLSHACTPSRAKRASGQAPAPSADPVVDTLCRVEKQCPLLWWSDRPVLYDRHVRMCAPAPTSPSVMQWIHYLQRAKACYLHQGAGKGIASWLLFLPSDKGPVYVQGNSKPTAFHRLLQRVFRVSWVVMGNRTARASVRHRKQQHRRRSVRKSR